MPAFPLATVLLIDDDSTTNYLNRLLLASSMQVAAQVLVADNGQEALARLAELCPCGAEPTCPQLILLDMNMPVMNGLEFLEIYAQLPAARRQSTVVVMLTTSLHERDQLRARHLPIADFLTKPLTRAKVTDLLAKHFSGVA